LNIFAPGRFFEQILWGLWHYLLPCVYKALYISWSTLTHPFICSLIQPLSLLKYLLSTYWNQVPVLDLWYIVINTNRDQAGRLIIVIWWNPQAQVCKEVGSILLYPISNSNCLLNLDRELSSICLKSVSEIRYIIAHQCCLLYFKWFVNFIHGNKSDSSKVVPEPEGLPRSLGLFLTRCNSSLSCTNIFWTFNIIVLRYSRNTSVSKKHLHFRCVWLLRHLLDCLRLSQPRHCWHLGSPNSLSEGGVEIVPCVVGRIWQLPGSFHWLYASSVHTHTHTHTDCDN